MDILKLLDISDPKSYKLHVARYNGTERPLDVFVNDRRNWHKWNEWRETKDDFNRQFILSLIEFYPERYTYVFGGIYQVLERKNLQRQHSYKVELLKNSEDLIGRLKIVAQFSRGRSFILENHIDKINFSEILKEPYDGEKFEGFENISIDFLNLEMIIKREKLDWKTALSSVKGIYLISDKKTGKAYVGKADGGDGVWQRWSSYIFTGHGFNKELVGLSKNFGIGYARKNFKFTIIEAWPFQTDDKVINKRETYWKDALLTRDFGYNLN